MQTIGFIGLGHMGGSMAARYIAAGYAVYGHDRERDHAQSLVHQGLRRLGSAREVAAAADVVMTSLPDEDIVQSVASGPNGILAGLSAGKLWADLSTISPDASRRLALRVRDEGGGAEMLDTPVSGSIPQVKDGTLTIIVGGDRDTYARIEPVLRVLGTPVRVGENGQGLVLKLAVNISLAVQLLAFSEGLLVAEREGIDPHLAAEVMTNTAIGSPMLKARVPLLLDRPDETWFDVTLMRKDIALALAAARQHGLLLPSAGLAAEVLTRATELGYGHRDVAAIHELLGRTPTNNARAHVRA